MRAGLILSLGLILVAAPALAQQETGAPSTFVVTGFRSANFGASEPEVRAAIARDFIPGSVSDIRTAIDPSTLVPVIQARVKNLAVDSGTAVVNYVFGYSSKRLTLVSVLWSQATDPNLTPDRLLVTGKWLANVFITKGYKPDGMVVGKFIKGGTGLILFRGYDAQGHMTLVACDMKTQKTSDNRVVGTPIKLILQYSADPTHQDIYHLPAGQF